MASLDQAFIKAYEQEDYTARPLPSRASSMGVDSPPLPDTPPREDATLEGACTPPESNSEIIDALESMPTVSPASPSFDEIPAFDEASEETTHRSLMPDSNIAAPEAQLPATELESEAMKFVETKEEASITNAICPMLQVDSFVWPAICTELESIASSELKNVVHALEAGQSLGKNMVALAGSRQGEGCTTLLLCLARQLAKRRHQVALVDADLESPHLASELGLLPESGWDDVLVGTQSLAEVLIDSVEDQIVLLPRRTSDHDSSKCVTHDSGFVALMDQMRSSFDFVLVDLGNVFRSSREKNTLPTTSPAVDSVVLVHDARRTTRKQLLQTVDYLDTLGISHVGVVENFESEDIP